MSTGGFKNKKRFIAGAVCPRCSEMDSLVSWEEDGKAFRECVSCEYQDSMKLDGSDQNLPGEIQTRVTPVGKTVLDDEEVPLKIVDPSKLH